MDCVCNVKQNNNSKEESIEEHLHGIGGGKYVLNRIQQILVII